MPLRDGLDVRAFGAGRRQSARPHQDRRRRQDHLRLRHGARHGARAPTGATPRAASCSRSAASRRSSATPAIARPASPARTARASAPSSCPTSRVRVANFHRETVKALAELVGAAGLDHPRELRPHHFMRRVAADRVVTFAELYRLPEARRVVVRYARRASSRRLGDGAVGQFRSGNHGRIARDLPSSRVELHCPDRVVTPIAGACASRPASSGAAPRRCLACRGGARSRRRWGSSSAKPP